MSNLQESNGSGDLMLRAIDIETGKPVEIGDEIIDHRGELKGQAIWPLDQGYGVHIME